MSKHSNLDKVESWGNSVPHNPFLRHTLQTYKGDAAGYPMSRMQGPQEGYLQRHRLNEYPLRSLDNQERIAHSLKVNTWGRSDRLPDYYKYSCYIHRCKWVYFWR